MSKEKILLIEDQRSMALLLHSYLTKRCPSNTILTAHTLKDAKELLASHHDIKICLTDLTLPDSSNYEVVELLKQYKVATVVFTGSYSEAVREKVFDAHVADYVIKDGQASIEYAVTSITALLTNSTKVIWVVSNNAKFIQRTQGLLRVQRYQVKVIEDYADIGFLLETSIPDLLVLDRLQGEKKMSIYDLIRQVRTIYTDHELPILAIENREKLNQSIKLMKYGVSDLLAENYLPEELYLRTRKNIEQSQAYKDIKRISETDSLTQLYNRRAFFEKAEELFTTYQKNNVRFFVIMADIDHFKQVNDKYGHQLGDEAIKLTASYLTHVFADQLVARFGGEEFIIFGQMDSEDLVSKLAEKFRSSIESQSYASIDIEFTISQGISSNANTLTQAISNADGALYEAKEQGRNCTVYHS